MKSGLEEFTDWLRDALSEKNLTQRYLAEMIDVPEQTISRWIHGHRKPNINMIQEILYQLGYHIEFVKDGE